MESLYEQIFYFESCSCLDMDTLRLLQIFTFWLNVYFPCNVLTTHLELRESRLVYPFIEGGNANCSVLGIAASMVATELVSSVSDMVVALS